MDEPYSLQNFYIRVQVFPNLELQRLKPLPSIFCSQLSSFVWGHDRNLDWEIWNTNFGEGIYKFFEYRQGMMGWAYTVMSVVTVSDAPPNNLHRGMRMLLATASISAISTPALALIGKHTIKYRCNRKSFVWSKKQQPLRISETYGNPCLFLHLYSYTSPVIYKNGALQWAS